MITNKKVEIREYLPDKHGDNRNMDFSVSSDIEWCTDQSDLTGLDQMR